MGQKGKSTMSKIVRFYDSRNATNDTLVVVLEKDGQPVDQFSFYREGNRVKVRGQWKTTDDAIAYATGRMTGKIER
jgi:hypothetical protein